MPEEPPTLPKWLAARKAIAERLKAAGVSEEEYMELWQLLDTVTGAEPDQLRARQFTEQAYKLLVDIQSATNKNQARVAVSLRQFAERIARALLPDLPEEELKERVDAIPDLELEL